MRSGLILLVLALLIMPSARAQEREPPRVIVLEAGRPALARRLAAELGALPSSTRLVTANSGEDAGSTLADLTRAEGAALGVALVNAGTGLHLAVFERTTGATVLVDLESDTSLSDEVLALRAVERLRAGWLLTFTPESTTTGTGTSASATRAPVNGFQEAHAVQRDPVRSPTPSPVAPKGVARPEAVVRSELIGVELGIALMTSPTGLPPVAAASLAAGVFVVRRVRLGVFSLMALHPMQHRGRQGASDSRVTLIGVDLLGELIERGPWRLSAALGVAAVIFTTKGQAKGPTFGDDFSRSTAACPYLRLGGSYRFTSHLGLRAELAFGVQPRPFALQYADKEVARWGAPWLASTVALEARFQ